jgi:hypothetical protein
MCGADARPGPVQRYWQQPYIAEDRDRLTVVEALKAISCYEYQACEHDDWDKSIIRDFCDTCRLHLIRELAGYEEVSWALTSS